MLKIDHLPFEEQEHFIRCHCGHYVDMRDLSDVVKHLHADMPEPEWSYSVKKGEAKAYTKSKNEIDLN